jgi:hypothetical protein
LELPLAKSGARKSKSLGVDVQADRLAARAARKLARDGTCAAANSSTRPAWRRLARR